MPIAIGLIGAGLILIAAGVTLSIGRTSTLPVVTTEALAKEPPKPFGYQLSDTDNAVLWAIPFKLWGANDAQYGRVTEADLAGEETSLVKLREWADHLPDGEVKRAYFGWVDAATKWIAEARHELTTHEREHAEQEERQKRATILSALPKP